MAPGRKPKSAGPAPPSSTLVLDNGADTIKAGFVTVDDDTSDKAPRVIPNCIARDRHNKTYVGAELEKCKDFGEITFRRPVEKGFIVNWEAQKEIWDRAFFDDKAPQRCDPLTTRLVLAEQPNSLPALQTHCDQIVFEEYGFSSYYRGIGVFCLVLLGPSLSAQMLTVSDHQAPRSTPTKTYRPYSTPQGPPILSLMYPPKLFC